MAKKIPLPNGKFAIVDDEDYERVSAFNWHTARKSNGHSDYAVSNVKMHRLIMDAPKGFMVDHINHDTLDNRKANLRLCTNAQNQQNTHSRGGSSRYRGVSFIKRRQRWHGQFMYEGRSYFCGSWATEEEAARAVDKKRKEVCGEFANLNIELD